MAVSTHLGAFALLTLSLYAMVALAWDRTIYLSADGGDDNCNTLGSPCRTLDRALDLAFLDGPNSTLVSLQAGRYFLGKRRNFTGVKDFAVIGHDGVEIRCGVNVSFYFALSDTIAIEGIRLLKCGDWHPSSVGFEEPFKPWKNVKFVTAVDFVYCRNIRLTDVAITQTAGLAVNLYDVGGEVNFTNCSFSENVARPSENESNPGFSDGYANAGGGIFLILNQFGYNPVLVTHRKHDSYHHDNTYVFRNCTFLRNEAPRPGLRDRLDSPQVPFSRGGGLGIYFRADATGCRILIQDCSFVHNKAQWGGGLQVEFRSRSERNALLIDNTVFEGNEAQFAGGGIRTGNIRAHAALGPNPVKISGCSFRRNRAVWGGAVALYGTSSPVGHTPSNASHGDQFVFAKTRFVSNTAAVGSALGIYMFTQNDAHVGLEVPFHVELDDCDVVDNYVISKNNALVTGEGAVYSLDALLTLSGGVTFINNTNTALSVDGTTVQVNGRVAFANNTGFRGGALSMYGRAKLRLFKKASLLFRENRCEEKGGAIYVATPGAPGVNFNESGLVNHLCFLAYEDPATDYDDWDATLVFQANRGPNAASGPSVYATTLKTCGRVGETARFNNSVLEWKFVKYVDLAGRETSAKVEISTDPIDLIFNRDDWNVAPSELFNATLELLDEKGQHVYGVVQVEIEPVRPESTVRLSSPSPLFLANNGKMTSIRLAGRSGEKFRVNLRSIGQQVLSKQITGVFLRHCHPGFRLEDSECICADSTTEGLTRCGNDGRTIYLRRNFWAGRVDGRFATYRCPDNYCACSEAGLDDCEYIPSEMCDRKRNQTSILCGSCERGYGVMFGSEVCSNECSNLYLLLLPVYGLVIVLVVMGILVIDLDVFTGYLNAWLYSYQVVSLLVREDFSFDPFMAFLIGTVNFQFRVGGSGSCLAAGLDESDKLAMSYVLPVFLMLVSYVLVKVVNAFPNWCYSKKVRAPFRAYSTVVVFSYTVITGISLRILHPAIINDRAVLFQNGEVDFFAGKHIAYGSLAIFFLITFVLPFPLFLMFRPFFTRCLRPVFNMNKLKLIFDNLQSCFEDDKRWCAAFYFVCRLVVLLLATYVPLGAVRRTLLQTVCIVTLAIFAFLKPYKQGRVGEESYSWINKSDAVLLTNLAVIATFSGAIGQSTASVDSTLEIFVDLFAYVPLAVLAVVVYRLIKRRRDGNGRPTHN